MAWSPLRWTAVALMLALASSPAQAGSEFRLDLVRRSLTGTHRHYQQFIDGVAVIGGERVTTERATGGERVIFESAASTGERGSAALAVRPIPAGAVRVFMNVNGQARPAFRTVIQRRPLERYARYVDAESGVLLREVALFYTVRGRVFDVNPVAKLNRPDLRDADDSAAAVPETAYDTVDLAGLAPSGMLTGINAHIVDLQAPFTVHAEASQPLEFDRSQPQFEEVNAWFQVDRAQRYLQSLGYDGPRALVAYSIPIDAHAANGTDNSFYVPGDVPGEGTLFFGDGGTDDAEDSDLVLHEFAHAIHDWISPGGLSGAVSSQAKAISEGFGDYWAFSSTYEKTIVSGRDPFCIADWDARCAGDDASQNCGYAEGSDCLRRVDSAKTIRDYIVSEQEGTEHLNGEIWSSALREIFMGLTHQLGTAQGKRVTDTLVLESLFALPPAPQFATVAGRMIDADRILRGGADVPAICGAMSARGLLAGDACGAVPRGQWTLMQSGDQGLLIPDTGPAVTSTLTITDVRAIEQLAVRVDIAHPDRGDLVIALVAPDGTTIRLKDSSAVDRTADVHATFGIDAPSVQSLNVLTGRTAAGTWQLVVSDVFAGATGALLSWGLLIQFAGDLPLADRPSGGDRRLIPAAGHVTGANGFSYHTDLYLLNRGIRAAPLVILFTPSGTDGRAGFAAVRTVVEAGQSIAFADVVQQVFSMTGIGALEIRGDLSSILAWSTTYRVTARGKLWQSVEAVAPASAVGVGEEPLAIAPIPPPAEMRTNVGVVETAGAEGLVRIVTHATGGEVAGSIDLHLAPFSHLQIPLVASGTWADVEVISGGARVVAYASMIDLASGDPSYLVASPVSPLATRAIVPAVISAPGAAGSRWATELFYVNASVQPQPDRASLTLFRTSTPESPLAAQIGPSEEHHDDALQELFGVTGETGQWEVGLPPGGRLVTRLYTTTAAGRVGQLVPTIPDSSSLARDAVADALHAESTPSFRTNIGITETTGSTVVVRVTLLSAAGRPLGSADRTVPPHGSVHFPISALFTGEVSGGRVHFEVVSGGGRALMYTSVIDNVTSDATFVPAE